MENNFEASRQFASAAACLQHLIDSYPQDATEQIWLEQSLCGLVVPHLASRFLFRGECGRFPETRASLERVRLSPGALADLQGLSEWLLRRLRELPDYQLSEFEALAALQHYGLPTMMLDFTANPRTAMVFAIRGSKDIQDYGRICVLPTASYRKGLMISELGEHRWALRARRQEAFGVVSSGRPSPDLKSSDARTRWGIRWYEIKITEKDRQLSAARYSALVDTDDDPTAGILRHHLIEYVEEFGKLSDDLARWLVEVDRIPIVPRVFKVLNLSEHEALTDHVAPNQIREFDEGHERDQTLRYLSKAYPDDSRDRVRDWVQLKPGDIVADPRTHHLAT